MLGRTGLIIFVLAVFLSGCGTLMPYKTEFQCKSPDKGKCATVKAAYGESKKNAADADVGWKGKEEKKDGGKDGESKKNAADADAGWKGKEEKKDGGKDGGAEKTGAKKNTPAASAKDVYRENLQRELSGFLEAPVTPVIIPPKVMRVLIFPYPDKTVLYMPRYIYMMIDEPEWVIGNYLIKENGSK
ncbi:MAG: type IV conjugative transfer system lipoprotein TraV [Deltaproteobacteria bacterium]|nr:type IV conjugative transfer system lipoprotein TraV [Deltaproteobacteria bacterium]